MKRQRLGENTDGTTQVTDDEIREGIITQKDFEDMEKEALKAQENNTPNNDSILDTEEAIRKRYE